MSAFPFNMSWEPTMDILATYAVWGVVIGLIAIVFGFGVRVVFRRLRLDNRTARIKTFGKEVIFSGLPTEDIFKFIADIEDLTGWVSEEERVSFAISRLRGNAGQWFRFRRFRADLLDWNALREHLLRQYGQIFNRADLADELFSKQYSLGEDFEQFVWKFRNLYLLWDPDAFEADIISALVKRLPGPLPFLLMHVQHIENLIRQFHRCQNIRSLSTTVSPPEPTRMEPIVTSYSTPRRSEPRVSARPQMSTTRSCYRCGEVGHLAPACPRREIPPSREVRGSEGPRCFRCQQVGHMFRECPTRGRTSENRLNPTAPTLNG